jgi:hypothetical protein
VSDFSWDVVIIPPIIAKLVGFLFEFLTDPVHFNWELDITLDKAGKYMYGCPQLLKDHLIVFVINEDHHQAPIIGIVFAQSIPVEGNCDGTPKERHQGTTARF